MFVLGELPEIVSFEVNKFLLLSLTQQGDI
jgi:hypothetical protein